VSENGERYLHLLRDTDTTMTELGNSMQYINIFKINDTTSGSYRDLVDKFRSMVTHLIDETKNLTLDGQNHELDTEIVAKLSSNWTYYIKIYDKIFTIQCTNSGIISSGPLKLCYDTWMDEIKDRALEFLRYDANEIIKYLDQAKDSMATERNTYIKRAISAIPSQLL